MAKHAFVSGIKSFVSSQFDGIVHEAETRYEDSVYAFMLPDVREAKIREFAQLLLVSRLVEQKGAWLSLVEMQYTLDLFHDQCRGHRRLNKYETHEGVSVGLLNETRGYLENQEIYTKPNLTRQRSEHRHRHPYQWTDKPGQ
jgi:hypothetical protein